MFQQNLHLVQFEVTVNKSNRDIVHHYDVMECADDYENNVKVAQNCHSNFPEYELQKCRGNRKLFIAWSIGGQYVRLQIQKKNNKKSILLIFAF